MRHFGWFSNIMKMSHLNFTILAFSTYYCTINIDLTGTLNFKNTPWLIYVEGCLRLFLGVSNPVYWIPDLELTLMNLNILLPGWNPPVRLNRQGLVRIHCRLALGSQTSNCPSCVCKARRKPMHFGVLSLS